MASVTSICNQALARVGGNRILTIDDNSTEAHLCKDVYDGLLGTVLEEHQWSFAIGRYALPISSGGGIPGQFANRFEIPSNVINVIRASDDPDDTKPNLMSWRVEGGFVVSDANKMYIKTVDKIIDPNKYSPLFRLALAIRVAAEIAWPLTANARLASMLLQEYVGIMSLAAQKDGQQGTSEQIRSGRYISIRSSGAGYSTIGPYV